jgi:hypothetical protein
MLGAHRDIRRRLRGSAAQRIFFSSQGALGAVFGARGAGDATHSTGPTKSGPGPAVAGIFPTARVRWALFLAGQGALGVVFAGQGALGAVFGRPGCAGRCFWGARGHRSYYFPYRGSTSY